MLNLKKVLFARPKEHEEITLRPLTTPWSDAAADNSSAGSSNPSNHPTPQFARAQWTSLNGLWDCVFVPNAYQLHDKLEAVVREAEPPAEWHEQIRVPFSPEAPLSSVDHKLQMGELLWYRRTIELAVPEGCSLVLHFQAVDAVCAVWCNGELLGTHSGGYTPFSFEIRAERGFSPNGSFEVLVCVADPSEQGEQLRGKQGSGRQGGAEPARAAMQRRRGIGGEGAAGTGIEQRMQLGGSEA